MKSFLKFHYPSNNQKKHNMLQYQFPRTKTNNDSSKKQSETTRQTNWS